MPVEFTPEFSFPSFMLHFGAESSAPPRRDQSATAAGSGTRLDAKWANVLPVPWTKDDETSFVIVIGCPVVGERIDKAAACLRLLNAQGEADLEFIRSLNGEFLIFHFSKKTGKLMIVNDRFNAYPLYYAHTASGLHATPYFSDMWSFLKSEGSLRFDEFSMFEFLWFQRVLGVKTHAKDAHYLPDATVMEFDGSKLSLRRYWRRDYSKNANTLETNAQLMADLTRGSIRRKTSDGRRYGHFLSGGMDSRSVLAAFESNPPVCFTATISENRECLTARAIAQTKGARHVHLTLDPEHYAEILRPSVHVNGGMYNYDHGLFYGFNRTVSDMVDVAFHGHGFDYMFQGMYIPRHRYKLAGRTLNFVTLAKVPDDIAGHFINNVSYRVKGADILSFAKPERRNELTDFLRGSVEEVLEDARRLSDNPYDHWEHLTFHHISRHYSYPNHASIATFVEQRTISFDNDLFNLYLSLPVRHRFDARIERRCLQLLDPRLASIRSANTALPVTASSLEQTVHQMLEFVKRRVKGFEDHEEWTERTWPERPQALRGQQKLKQAALDAVKSDALDSVSFLDADRLRASVPKWLDGEAVPGLSGDFVQTLLTLLTFLRQ